ncbi:MAG: hypothetical protein CM1200mP1_08040 [Candidatus Neomarinimicrobiota bacterium]|nr:MAG: hypothetical protein CM1200mP1_08040 [Candidatus Neomarinimicrobiota bacterium]
MTRAKGKDYNLGRTMTAEVNAVVSAIYKIILCRNIVNDSHGICKI